MKLTLKRIMAMMLVVAMVLGMMPAVFGANGTFADVDDAAWYAAFVKEATEKGYMNGVGNNKFNPDGTCTRAMVVTVLYRVAGQPAVGGPASFTDLTADWYANPVAWAQKTGVVNGVTATTFGPDQNVTREQLVTMIWRSRNKPAAAGSLTGFPDADKVSEYAKDAVAWAIGAGIINGIAKNGESFLAPQDFATRAQFAKIIVLAAPCEHAWDEFTVIEAATCGTAGKAEYTCSECGESEIREIPATGKHTWDEGKITVEPTCKDEGVKTFTCTVCGATKNEPVEKTNEHNFVNDVCSICGKVREVEYKLSSELNEGDKVVIVAAAKNMALSATYNGYYNAAAEVAPVDGILYAPAADLIWTVGKEGDYYTFSYEGQKIGMADSYSSMPLGEKNNTWQILPALTEGAFYILNVGRQVYVEYYEQNSNWSGYYNNSNEELFAMNFYVRQEVDTCKHQWDEGVVTKEPTCAEEGELTSTCALCGEKRYAPIPATGEHNFVNHECTVCGEKEIVTGDTYIRANELKEGDEVIIVCDSRNIAIGADYAGSYYNPGVAVAPVDGVITTEDTTIVWTVGKEGDFYTFSYNGQKLGMGTEFTSMSLGGVNYKWEIRAAENEGTFYVVNLDRDPAQAYYMQWYEAKNYWSGYYKLNDELMAMSFYVKGEAACDHAWDDGVVTAEPTCVEEGETTYTCTKCGEEKYESIPATGEHNFVNHECTVCGEKEIVTGDTYIRANELKEGDEVIIVCDSRNIAIGADYAGSYYNPGVAVAPVDGVITTEDTTIVWTVGKEGDFYTFSYNGQKLGMGTEFTSMSLGGVNYKWEIRAAENEGTFYVVNLDRDPAQAYYMQWYEAKNYWSGYYKLNDELMAMSFYVKGEAACDHAWDDGVVTAEPTCVEEGETTYTCTKCGEEKYETIPATGEHNFVDDICTVCGESNEPEVQDIVILYTNDIHTYINNGGLKYSNVAALKAELEAEGKAVLLIDAGDHVQGTAYGSMDKGETIIKLMNAAGYDLATLGNHEFDYGMERALELVGKADFPYVSANFYNEKNGVRGENVLDSYKIFEVGGLKIAIVGITTPETFTKTTPAYFMDDAGNYIYGISGGEDGSNLYADVQAAVDAAWDAGADYVIALGHLGDDPASDPWNSEDVIANVEGLDAFIDGHSHSTVEGKDVEGKDGYYVRLTQTGQYLNAIGMLTISDYEIDTKLITEYTGVDADVKAIEEAWAAEVDELLGEVIAKSEVNFKISDDSGRLIRKMETNLGDFCADALYYLFEVTEGLGADVAIMNGGGIRANMDAGDVSYKTTKTVHTFGNVACLIEVSGQQILDALEWGAKNVGVGENGGFLHVAGVTYEIHSYIPSTVQADDKGVWTGAPTGEYRVKNVMIGGEKLDVTKTYKLAGYNYTLRDLGDGFAMFDGAVNVKDYVMEDYMVLANYAKSFPEGTIKADNSVLGANYGNIYGEGRITIVTEAPGCVDHNWTEAETTAPTCVAEGKTVYVCSICGATEEETIPATGEHTYVDGTCTGCGKDEPNEDAYVLTDVLKDGDKVVIVAAAKNMALSASYNGYYNAAVEVAPVDGKIFNPTADLVWTVGVEGDTYTFSYEGQKLGMADSYSSMPLGEKNDTWQILPAQTEGAFYILNIGRQVYVEYYEKNSNWSGYYNNADEALFAMNFYVLGAQPCEHAWDDGVVTTEPTCVAEGELTYTCTKCEAEKYESIPATGEHTYVDGTCTGCGKKEENNNDSGFVVATELKIGDKIVITAAHEGTYYAVANDGDSVKNALNAATVSVTANGLDIGSADVIWEVCAGSAEGTYILKSSTGLYINYVSGTTVKMADTGTDWSIGLGEGVSQLIAAADASRMLVFRNNAGVPQFRCYKSSNSTGEYSQAITIYKQVG